MYLKHHIYDLNLFYNWLSIILPKKKRYSIWAITKHGFYFKLFIWNVFRSVFKISSLKFQRVLIPKNVPLVWQNNKESVKHSCYLETCIWHSKAYVIYYIYLLTKHHFFNKLILGYEIFIKPDRLTYKKSYNMYIFS